MINDIQANADITTIASFEQPQQYDFMQDAELVHVGGGSGLMHF